MNPFDLVAEAAAGRFREDLLYRINVAPLVIPPLRDRAEDVELLWDHFTRVHGGEGVTSEPDLLADLVQRPWRGNVRELKNLNQRLPLMRKGDVMTADDLVRLAPAVSDPPPPRRSRTAAYLGIPRHVLVYRLSKYNIG